MIGLSAHSIRRQSQSGQTIVLVALSMVAILAVIALAIDIVTLYVARNEAQHAADAGALAGAKMLVDSGLTSDPCNTTLAGNAQAWAGAQATAVAQQNLIAGQTGIVTVSFPNGPAVGCTGSIPGSFEINPQIAVQVQRAGLPTFFARIWNRTAASVSATATAEGYNPSNASATASNALPLAPRCPKPMALPNCDPVHAGAGTVCGTHDTFVDRTTGAITHPGQFAAGGVIGETFTFTSGCQSGSGCVPTAPTVTGTSTEYYPLNFDATVHSCRSCGTSVTGLERDIACCSDITLQCGASSSSTIETSVNPDGNGGAGQVGGQCMIHEPLGNPYSPGGCYSGNPNQQDCLDPTFAPFFRMLAGTSNPYLGGPVAVGTQITTSDSVATFPIYDDGAGLGTPPSGSVQIVGFLQLFINDVKNNGIYTATVLNVSGCDTSLPPASPPSRLSVQGAGSMLPVRLIHQ